jgi:hypothetical protein
MLTNQETIELNSFLSRLQGQIVRVEISSRLNSGFRMSFAVKLEKQGDNFSFSSQEGAVSLFIDPNAIESFGSDHSSVSLLFGDQVVTIRYARKR